MSRILRADNGYFLKDPLSGVGQQLKRERELLFIVDGDFQEGGLPSREKDARPALTEATDI